jgi:spore germination protein KA
MLLLMVKLIKIVMPLRIKNFMDTFIRFPIWSLNLRSHDPHPKKMNQERYSREWEQDDPRKE